MSQQAEQTFASHRRYVPLYHFVALPFFLVYLVYGVYVAVTDFSVSALFTAALAFVLLVVGLFARVFAVGVQDRVIRLEERLRLMALCPDDLKGRINELSTRHLVALRFAADDECVELATKALNDPSMGPEDIKRQIRRWRPDHHRI